MKEIVLIIMMLKYEEINRDNINIATKIQMSIFPNESAYQAFCDCIDSDKEYNKYFLVYDNETIIGVTGLYTTTDIKLNNTLWMGWFGILKEHRRKGYGTQVIKDTIDMAKEFIEKYHIKYFRVFTSSIENPDVLPLYTRLFDFKEEYNNEEDLNFNNSCLVYTKILGNYKEEKWNNRFLNIREMIEKEKIGNSKFN